MISPVSTVVLLGSSLPRAQKGPVPAALSILGLFYLVYYGIAYSRLGSNPAPDSRVGGRDYEGGDASEGEGSGGSGGENPAPNSQVRGRNYGGDTSEGEGSGGSGGD